MRRGELGKVAAALADLSILTSDNPASEDPMNIINDIAAEYGEKHEYVAIPDRREAIEYAFRNAREGDIVLLAGKGHEKYQLIGTKREPFCERDILMEFANSPDLVEEPV